MLRGQPCLFQGHIVGEEAIDLKTGGSIRVKEPDPVNESAPDTEGVHRFEKEVMIDAIESLLLIQENEGRLHILIIGQLYEVPKHMDSVVDYPAIHRGLGVVDDGRKDLFQPVSQGLDKNFDIDIKQGDWSVILQSIHIALLLVENGSNGGILTRGELGLPGRIDISEILRVNQVPETFIEFSSDAVNARTLLVL